MSSEAVAVMEGDGFIDVCVTVNLNAQFERVLTVHFEATGLTASGFEISQIFQDINHLCSGDGSDFSQPDIGLLAEFSGIVAGPVTGCDRITILEDVVIEGSEKFTVNIVNAGTALMTSPFVTTVTIDENDSELLQSVTAFMHIYFRWRGSVC